MRSGKFWVTGAAALGAIAFAQSAFADPIVITPGEAQNRVLEYQAAGPTRYFNVEKANTLPAGSDRFGANLQVGTLGTGAGVGMAGGVNLRADFGVTPGFEAGIDATGLGASGSNLLGNLNLRGKLGLSEFSLGSVPVRVGGTANIGAFAAGGGVASAAVGIGFPFTAALGSRVNISVDPGLGFGFATNGLGVTAGGLGSQLGLTPALGLGIDWNPVSRLSLIADGSMGFNGGLTTGDVGLRYGFTDNFAGDLFAGYNGNPLNAVNSGTVGIGGFYAF